MKELLYIAFIVLTMSWNLDGQALTKNGVSGLLGIGFSESSHSTQSFSISYQREIYKSLYIFGEYTSTQGSQSFESLFGESPELSQYGEFGESYQVYVDDAGGLFGRLIQVSTWSLGLKKYIRLTPKTQMAAGFAFASNRVNEMNVEGITNNSDGTVNYDNVYPTYGTYNSIGGKVGFEFLYNLKDAVNLVVRADYMTFESFITLSVGSTVSF